MVALKRIFKYLCGTKRRLRLNCDYLVDMLVVLKVEFKRFQALYKANYYEDLFRDCSDSK